MFRHQPEHLSVRQKYDLVYQRVLLQNPKVVFCVQPFQGADLEMRIHIWELLEQLLKRGAALVVLAINLADSLSLASRLIRIRQGASPEVYEQAEFARIPFSAPLAGPVPMTAGPDVPLLSFFILFDRRPCGGGEPPPHGRRL